MNIHIICQWTVLALVACSLLLNLKRDIEGQENKPPGGYKSAVISMVVLALFFAVLYGAGAFSEIFGGGR